MRKRGIWLIAMLMVLSLVAAACADEEPSEGDNGSTEEEPLPGEGFLACQVTDTGGVDDRSFNQTAFKGLEGAEAEFGIETQVLESQSPNDFEPNIQSLIQQECDLIVTVGFLLGDATAAAAEANPDQNFAIVDVDFFDPDGSTTSPSTTSRSSPSPPTRPHSWPATWPQARPRAACWEPSEGSTSRR